MASAIISFIIFVCSNSPVDSVFMIELMMRESEGVATAVGDQDAPTGTSVGLFQFQHDTYDWAYEKVFGEGPNWDATDDPRTNEVRSIMVAHWMLENGYAEMWTAGREMISEGLEVECD